MIINASSMHLACLLCFCKPILAIWLQRKHQMIINASSIHLACLLWFCKPILAIRLRASRQHQAHRTLSMPRQPRCRRRCYSVHCGSSFTKASRWTKRRNTTANFNIMTSADASTMTNDDQRLASPPRCVGIHVCRPYRRSARHARPQYAREAADGRMVQIQYSHPWKVFRKDTTDMLLSLPNLRLGSIKMFTKKHQTTINASRICKPILAMWLQKKTSDDHHASSMHHACLLCLLWKWLRKDTPKSWIGLPKSSFGEHAFIRCEDAAHVRPETAPFGRAYCRCARMV